MKEELNLAKKLQTEILPDIPSVAGIQIHSMYLPMMEVGGDLYDLFQIRPGVLRVFLADATGHGIQAALLTMTLKGILESIKKRIPIRELFSRNSTTNIAGISEI
ncbi:stage II sporulation protein E domain protein [Leptospira borgpetersenii str. Noumea 25]|nr:stage II sporulation protein E domain protein [Leptospira borgpetersenii str. Noumea 25]